MWLCGQLYVSLPWAALIARLLLGARLLERLYYLGYIYPSHHHKSCSPGPSGGTQDRCFSYRTYHFSCDEVHLPESLENPIVPSTPGHPLVSLQCTRIRLNYDCPAAILGFFYVLFLYVLFFIFIVLYVWFFFTLWYGLVFCF